jgi:hypothetical protein
VAITAGPANRARASHLYELIVDAVQGLTLPELMAVKRGDDWATLPDDVRSAFETVAAQLAK